MKKFFVFALLLTLNIACAWATPSTRLACIGDSITAGLGLSNPSQDAYPARLSTLLGSAWEVRNFGMHSATVLQSGTKPYDKQSVYRAALDYTPDVVIIALGTNDSRPENIEIHPDDFEPRYSALVSKFREVNPKVRIYACLPPPAFPDNYGIRDSVLVGNVIPAIQHVATQMGLPIIDLHTSLRDKARCFPDRVHPNEEGALLIARTIYQGLTGRQLLPIHQPCGGFSILPLGDSLTLGTGDSLQNGGGSGYRDQLYARLTGANVPFHFVGSSMAGASSALRAADQDFHEGHLAYQLSDLLNNLEANQSDPSNSASGGYWLTGAHDTDRDAIYPNIVLLLAGIEDIRAKTSLETMQQRMTALLDWFGANRPTAHVLVGTLLPYDDTVQKTKGYNDKVCAFNTWLRDTIAAKYSGSVTLVDQYALFVDATRVLKTKGSLDSIYLSDGLHPSHGGYQAMGDAWFAAIESLVSGPEATSLVVTSTDDSIDPLDGQTTLREAITYANTLSGTPTITFDPHVFNATRQTIMLSGTRLPDITTSMNIDADVGRVGIDAGEQSDILWTSGSHVTLKSLTFVDGINQCVQNLSGTLVAENCTFFNNPQAIGSNGEVDSGATLLLHNCTVSGNGLGVFSQGSSNITLKNCTVANNSVGLGNEDGMGIFTVSNTIVASNSQVDTDTPVANSAFSIIGTDAGLDPAGLRNNGGLTSTIALELNSPAINAGDPNIDSVGSTDQRQGYFARVRAGRIDIGAFEVQNFAPVTHNDFYATLEDTPLTIDTVKGVLANDWDLDKENTLSAKIVAKPAHGQLSLSATGAFTYLPALNFNGTDAFTYLVSNGKLGTSATATIKVSPVNDAPTATVSLLPAIPSTNTVLRAQAVGTDADGDRVAFKYIWKKNDAVLGSETGSTLDLAKAGNGDKGQRISVTAVPTDGFSSGPSTSAMVVIGNTTPLLTTATFNGHENQMLLSGLVGHDADQEKLFYSVLRAPRYGTLQMQSNGAFTYTPKANWHGTDSFTARVVDGSGASATAVFNLNVASTNGTPVAMADEVKGFEDVPLSIAASTLLKNDLNGENPDEVDTLKITKIAVPASFPGTLSLDVTKQTILFTPKPNWNGTTNFTYTVQDSGRATASALVTLQIAPVNDAPVALGGRMTVISGSLGELPLSGGDVEGDSLTFALGGKPVSGAATVVKVGIQWLLRYQSKFGFVGTDTLTIIACDGHLNSTPTTVTITVKPNHAPQLLGITPNSGTLAVGSTLVFEQKVMDEEGTANLDAVALLISASSTTANARGGAVLWFDAINNRFTLTADDGKTMLAPIALGGTLENGQMQVTLGPGNVTRASNGILTLKWHVTFKSNFVGLKSLWGHVEDRGGLRAGFSQNGAITLTSMASSAPAS